MRKDNNDRHVVVGFDMDNCGDDRANFDGVASDHYLLIRSKTLRYTVATLVSRVCIMCANGLII